MTYFTAAKTHSNPEPESSDEPLLHEAEDPEGVVTELGRNVRFQYTWTSSSLPRSILNVVFESQHC